MCSNFEIDKKVHSILVMALTKPSRTKEPKRARFTRKCHTGNELNPRVARAIVQQLIFSLAELDQTQFEHIQHVCARLHDAGLSFSSPFALSNLEHGYQIIHFIPNYSIKTI